jgi:hypothetical protein
MDEIDTVYTELDKLKSEERKSREREEMYDQREEELADELDVSPDSVVKAERTTPEPGDSVLYVQGDDSVEAYVVQESAPRAKKHDVSVAFGTYTEGTGSASAGVYDAVVADNVAALEEADIAIGPNGEIQRRDESTVVDVAPDYRIRHGA